MRIVVYGPVWQKVWQAINLFIKAIESEARIVSKLEAVLVQAWTYLADKLLFRPNNESDPSSEYSPLGLTHVMNQYLGQKFTTWVKINCLDTILKPRNGIPRPCTRGG